jgi:ribosome maturation factor RimP
MVQKEQIEKLVNEVVSGPCFLVDITVSPGNMIEVVVDCDQGITIEKCVEISRHIEGNLDRETEDFSLNVSSPGLGKPFKVHRQYVKNIGREVEVSAGSNAPVRGVLKNVDSEGFDVESKTLEKVEGKKKKEEVIRTNRFLFTDGVIVKNYITFK